MRVRQLPWGLQKPPPGTPLLPWHPLCAGLLALWPMNEAGGNKVYDVSGHSLTGTWQGTLGSQWGTGPHGAVGVFNGSNNAVLMPTSTTLQWASGTPRTLAGWARLDAAGSYPMILSGGGTAASSELRCHSTARTPEFSEEGGGNATSATAVAVGTWHHYCGTGTPTLSSIYVDGVLQGTFALTASQQDSSAYAIGSRSGSSLFWTGQIAMVGIWSRALSAAEVQQLYTQPYCMFAPRALMIP